MMEVILAGIIILGLPWAYWKLANFLIDKWL